MQSPCVKVCVVHPGTGYCVGCHRTLAEIGGWTGLTDAERTAIMAELPAREGAHRAASARASARTGRARRTQSTAPIRPASTPD